MTPIKKFAREQYDQALESWSWLDLAGKTPRFTSLFGDVFLESADGWWFLDTMDGKLTQVWTTEAELQAAMNTQAGQDEFLLLGLARAVKERGIILADNEIYALTPPPILGGSFDPTNAESADFVVAVNLAGQIHHQIRDLPPGTRISGVDIS